MRKELNILVIFFVLAVTPLALYFSQQKQTTQQNASGLQPTIEAPTLASTEIPTPTASNAATSIPTVTSVPRVTTFPTR
jgi:hypothetical protein